MVLYENSASRFINPALALFEQGLIECPSSKAAACKRGISGTKTSLGVEIGAYRCNEQKLDQPPEQFYTPQELAQLPAIFAQQAALFDFAFDEEAWVQGPAAYLVSLGLDEELVEQLLHDELHPDYIGMPDPRRVEFTISMDVSSLLKDLGKDTAV